MLLFMNFVPLIVDIQYFEELADAHNSFQYFVTRELGKDCVLVRTSFMMWILILIVPIEYRTS